MDSEIYRNEMTAPCGCLMGSPYCDCAEHDDTGWRPLRDTDPLQQAWTGLRVLAEVGMVCTKTLDRNRRLVSDVWHEIERLRDQVAELEDDGRDRSAQSKLEELYDDYEQARERNFYQDREIDQLKELANELHAKLADRDVRIAELEKEREAAWRAAW